MEDDPNWYTAEFSGRKGYVPKNYIELKSHTYVFKSKKTSLESNSSQTILLEIRWHSFGDHLVL